MNDIETVELLRSAKFTKTQANTIIAVLQEREKRLVSYTELKSFKAELITHIYTAVGIGATILSLIRFI